MNRIELEFLKTYFQCVLSCTFKKFINKKFEKIDEKNEQKNKKNHDVKKIVAQYIQS